MPVVPAARTPVVFIHGLWLHADSWKPWVELFRAAGYDATAPRWPGEPATVAESNAHPERLANVGIDDVVEHYAAIIRKLPTKPIVIGHSFGGLVAQKLLGMGLASAAVALDPAQIRGVLPLPLAQLKSAFPVLGNPFNYTKATRGPLLITGGGKDHTVPEVVSRATYKLYRKAPSVTDYKVFPDRGHSLTVDSGWKEVANASLSWLKSKGM